MKTRIRHFRKLRDLTLEELGARIGMSVGNLSKLERGLIPYDQYTLESAARELGVRPAELIDDVPDQTARERALTDLLRGLPPEEQDRLIKMATAFAEPPDKDGKLTYGKVA